MRENPYATRAIHLSCKSWPCPVCRVPAKRHSEGVRNLREMGVKRPTRLKVTYSKHYCPHCRKHFSRPLDHIAPVGARFTGRVKQRALEYYLRGGLTLAETALRMRQIHFVFVPPTTIHDWTVAELAT